MDTMQQLVASQDGQERLGQRSSRSGLQDDVEALAPSSRGTLSRAIEFEVIPRLLLSRTTPARAADEVCFSVEDVERFAETTLTRDSSVSASFMEAMRSRGLPLEALYLQLLAPTARRLGELWEEDYCDFGKVTVGLGRLQHMMRDLSPAFQQERGSRPRGRRVLLMATPGEQHTFGLTMVADFFRRAGWLVRCNSRATAAELVGSLRHETFEIVGISLGGETHLDSLSSAIRSIRRTSQNQGIGVMVGGPLFTEHPEMAALVGADATAGDGRHAVMQAENLLAVLSHAA